MIRATRNKDAVPITDYAVNHDTITYSEFEPDDIDKEVDEMPDDCLIYDDLFGN